MEVLLKPKEKNRHLYSKSPGLFYLHEAAPKVPLSLHELNSLNDLHYAGMPALNEMNSAASDIFLTCNAESPDGAETPVPV